MIVHAVTGQATSVRVFIQPLAGVTTCFARQPKRSQLQIAIFMHGSSTADLCWGAPHKPINANFVVHRGCTAVGSTWEGSVVKNAETRFFAGMFGSMC